MLDEARLYKHDKQRKRPTERVITIRTYIHTLYLHTYLRTYIHIRQEPIIVVSQEPLVDVNQRQLYT